MASHPTNLVGHVIDVLNYLGGWARIDTIRACAHCPTCADAGIAAAKHFDRIEQQGRGSGTEYRPRRKRDHEQVQEATP